MLDTHESSEIRFEVTEVIIHPEYLGSSHQGFDIAIYKVNDKSASNRREIREGKIFPACLPRVDEEYGVSNPELWVAGWGLVKEKPLKNGQSLRVKGLQNSPRHTKVPIQKCQDDRRRTVFPQGLICAGTPERDSCKFDDGGPLMNVHESKYEWVGIVSFGFGCGQPGSPGAYTRTSCFLAWIASQFGLKGTSTNPSQSSAWSTACPSFTNVQTTSKPPTINIQEEPNDAIVINAGKKLQFLSGEPEKNEFRRVFYVAQQPNFYLYPYFWPYGKK